MKTEHKVFTASILLGFTIWIIDAVLDTLVFYQEPFLDLLILKIPQHELYIRCLILGFFLAFGLLMSRVISKQKKTEDTLQESEKKYRTLFSNMTSGLALHKIVLDDNGKPVDYIFLEVNKAFEVLTGLKKEDILQKRVTEVLPGIENSEFDLIGTYGKVALTGKSIYLEEQFAESLDRYYSVYAFSPKINTFATLFLDVTERRKIEDTLKVSEEKHRTLFETMVQGVVYQGTDGKIFSANKTAEKILGLSLDQMQGRTSIDPRWKAIHEDGSDFPGEDHPAMVALKTGKEVHNVLMGIFNPKLEDYTWININATPQFRSGEKSPYQVYTTFEDITIQKIFEKEMLQYKHIVSSSTDMMALLDKQFKYLTANKAYANAFNLTLNEIVGQTISKIFGEEFFETAIKPSAEKCLSKETTNYQDWFEFPALGRVYIDITYSPYLSMDNEVIGFVMNARNITERKRAEEELENIFNLSPDMVAVFTTEGGLLKVNPSWEKVLGYTQKELLDMGWTKLVHPDDVDKTNKEVEKQLKGSSVVSFTNRYKCKDGSYKTLEWQASCAIEGIVHATARDVTERKKAEEKLEKSQKELKKLTAHLQTVREEERTLVAHELHDDIGQALSALKMDIFMLQKKLPKDQKAISDQIKETNDLLDKTIQTTRKIYSELRPTLLEHFSIKEVLEDLLDTFKESNNFSGNTDIDLEGIELKEEQTIAIYRIVQEALNNIKWHSQAKTVKIRLKKKTNQLELMIKDDGIGIKKDDLIKSNSFGTLGMKERAEFLEGEIEFKGIPEKGTTVTVTIPLNPESA